ncbi:alpha/beta hydrolase [Enterococcus diestrammenae]|uniref:alpha/beta hydrolase n=1 Tax=Enterococcus diestrammenae TaxID=1155073 RepID=UPI00195CCC8D
MALLQVNCFSNVLDMQVMINVILPQQTKKRVGTDSVGVTEDVPVLYLLHGMGGNHSVWERRTSLERYVDDLGLAVVMPATDHGWYTDTTYDMKYWTYLSEELPELIHTFFPQLTTKREKTFAAGLSMGGYGAVKWGLRCPEQFAAVASLSGALAFTDDPTPLLSLRKRAYWEGIFGQLETLGTSMENPLYLLSQTKPTTAPKLFICCGTEDDLYPISGYFAKKASEKGFDVTYEEGTGVHDWAFWDRWLPRVLEWLPLEK